jgi:hypothetical protein
MSRDARRVDQDIDRPKCLQRAIDQPGDVSRYGHVGMDIDRRAQFLGQGCPLLVQDVGEHNLRALIDQDAGTFFPHAAYPAGNHRHLS